MGIMEFMKGLFGGRVAPEPAVAAVVPNDELAAVDFPRHPDFEAAIASDADPTTAWRVYADWLIDQGISWGEVIASALQGNPNEQRRFKHLTRLELDDNHFSVPDQAAIKAVLPMAEFGTQKEDVGPEFRYASVGE
jgi:uncharacterized protein (TIGR02996 family)